MSDSVSLQLCRVCAMLLPHMSKCDGGWLHFSTYLLFFFPQSKTEPFSQGEYNVYSTFQSHEPEFDYLKSLEIEEKINKIRWLPQQNAAHFLLSTNGERPPTHTPIIEEQRTCGSSDVLGWYFLAKHFTWMILKRQDWAVENYVTAIWDFPYLKRECIRS